MSKPKKKKKLTNDYWRKRARQDKLKVIRTQEKGIDNLKRLLKTNLDDVEKKITAFYDKYADNYTDTLTYTQAVQYKMKLKQNAYKFKNDKILQKILREDAPKYKIERLRALQTDLQIQLAVATAGQQKGIYKTLEDVAKVSQSSVKERFKDVSNVKFNTIADKKLQKIIGSDWSGKNWSDRLWKDREKVGLKVQEIIETGLPQGRSLQDMARDLKDATQSSFNDAFRLIRTEAAHVDGQVKLEGYKQSAKDLGYTEYVYDAFLDDRTSKICQELNGKKIPIDEAEVGVNYPPMHPNCRSTTHLDEGSIDDDFDFLPDDVEPKEKEEEIQEEKQIEPIGNKDVDFSNVVESARWKAQGQDYAGNIIAKDIETAQKIAEQNGVIVANFERMSLEQANEINKALTLLPRGARPDYIADAKTMIEKNQLGKTRGLKSFFGVSFNNPSAIKNVYGKYVEIDYIVGYNTTTYKSFKAIEKAKIDFNKKMAESFAKGEQKLRGTTWTGKRWYFNTQGNATIYHELAHSYANKNGIPKGFEELGKRWAKESNIGQIQTIGEAWAEAFAGYNIKNPELPDYIKEFMKGLKL